MNKPIFILVLLVLLRMFGASIVGIVAPSFVYGGTALRSDLLPNDWVNLLIGVPFLITILAMLVRDPLLGWLLLPGGLFFAFYSYIPYAVAMRGDWQTVVYLPMLLSVLIAALVWFWWMDHKASAEKIMLLSKEVCGVVLFLLGLLLIVRQIALIIGLVVASRTVGSAELGTWLADSLFAAPLLIYAAVLIFRRHPVGFTLAPGLLLAYALLAFAVMPVIFYQAISHGEPVAWIDLLVLLVMAMLCFFPSIRLLRALKSPVHDTADPPKP